MKLVTVLACCALSVAVTAPVAVGASSASAGTPVAVTASAQQPANAVSVPRTRKTKLKIKGHRFRKRTLKVKRGRKIVVINKDSHDHTVTSNTGAWPEVYIPAGQRRTFRAPRKLGKYRYHCRLHPFMKAKIKVTRR